MNAVAHIDFPTLEDLEKYRDTIPAYEKMLDIIQKEVERGNVVVHIGDAGCMPQETYVVVDFAYEPTCEHEKIKVCRTLNPAHSYKYLSICDRKGGTSFAFGAWKHRMGQDYADAIQRRLVGGVYD